MKVKTESENKNPRDEFSELIKQKMEDFTFPPDNGTWELIEERLKPKSKKAPVWIWLSMGAAAIFALFFLLTPLYKAETIETAEATEQKMIGDKNDNTSSAAKNVMEGFGNEEQNTRKAIQGNTDSPDGEKGSLLQGSASDIGKHNLASTNAGSNVNNIDKAVLAEREKGDDTPFPQSVKENETQKGETLIAEANDVIEKGKVNDIIVAEESAGKQTFEEKKISLEFKTLDKEIENVKTKYKAPWTIAALVGSRGEISAPNSTYEMYYVPAATENGLSFAPRKQVEETMDDITYLPPISITLNARKDFSRRVGVSSGVIYSYLPSIIYDREHKTYEQWERLHYLGIPVNVIFNLYPGRKWDVYLSAGGTFEKGIRAVSSLTTAENGEIHKGEKSSKIDGFQYSANTSLGVNYWIYNDIGIYFEPRISYYFNTDQPKSIRTERPFTFGMNIGVQYRFR